MTENELKRCREEFESEMTKKAIDCSKRNDNWGNPVYMHPHVESMWYGFQLAWQHQSALLAKAVEALEFAQDKLLCDETYNCKLIKDKIQTALAEITKGDNDAK